MYSTTPNIYIYMYIAVLRGLPKTNNDITVINGLKGNIKVVLFSLHFLFDKWTMSIMGFNLKWHSLCRNIQPNTRILILIFFLVWGNFIKLWCIVIYQESLLKFVICSTAIWCCWSLLRPLALSDRTIAFNARGGSYKINILVFKFLSDMVVSRD